MFTHLHLKPVGMPLPKNLYKLLMKNNIKVNITMRINAKVIQFQLNKKILQTLKNMSKIFINSLEFFLMLSKHLFFTLPSSKVNSSLFRVSIVRSK